MHAFTSVFSEIATQPIFGIELLLLSHVNDTANAISLLHCLKSRIYLWKRLSVSDELIYLELALHVIVNQVWELGAALNSAKSASLENASSENFSATKKRVPTFQTRPVTSWNAAAVLAVKTSSAMDRLTPSRDLLSRSCDPDDDALTPSFVARLQSRTHHANVSRAVKSVVASAIGHLDQFLDDGLVLQVAWVHEIGGTELLGPFLLIRVQIHDDDFGSLLLHSALDDRKTDTACAKDGNSGALLNIRSHRGCAIARCDTTS
jgi:hypothetical protein